MAKVELRDLKKSFGPHEVIKSVDLAIETGEFCVFVGPSGCGKSTLLRMIAGLEDPTSGDVLIGETRMNDVAPRERGISMVFQSYALFPHKTVYENIAYGLRISKTPRDELETKVREAAETLKLDQLLQRKPAQLSGGQRQRVAIGRSIVRNPKVFLFDEPLSNLDAALRVSMRTEIAQLHERLPATMIYVTHDQIEAMTLADKIVVLRDGQIEQVGSPVELYERPGNVFVAQFIGSPKMNVFGPSERVAGAAHEAHLLGLRPEHVTPCAKADALLGVTPTHTENLGEYTLAYFHTDAGNEFVAKLYEPFETAPDGKVYFTAPPNLRHLFDAKTTERVIP